MDKTQSQVGESFPRIRDVGSFLSSNILLKTKFQYWRLANTRNRDQKLAENYPKFSFLPLNFDSTPFYCPFYLLPMAVLMGFILLCPLSHEAWPWWYLLWRQGFWHPDLSPSVHLEHCLSYLISMNEWITVSLVQTKLGTNVRWGKNAQAAREYALPPPLGLLLLYYL